MIVVGGGIFQQTNDCGRSYEAPGADDANSANNRAHDAQGARRARSDYTPAEIREACRDMGTLGAHNTNDPNALALALAQERAEPREPELNAYDRLESREGRKNS